MSQSTSAACISGLRLRRSHSSCNRFVKSPPVRQAGQGVGDRHTQQLLLHFLAKRDVEQSADYQLPARVTQPTAAIQHPNPNARSMTNAVLALQSLRRVFLVSAHLCQNDRQILRVNTRLPCGMGGANLLVGGQAEHRQTAGRKPEAVGSDIPLPESQPCALQGDGDPFLVIDLRCFSSSRLWRLVRTKRHSATAMPILASSDTISQMVGPFMVYPQLTH